MQQAGFQPVRKKTPLVKYIYKKRYLYLMCIPGIAYLIVFHYVPLYGIIMAAICSIGC